MKVKKILFFGALLCLLSAYYGKSDPKSPEYDVLAHRIRSQTAKQLKKEKNLIASGTMGQMMGDVQAVGLTFQYFQQVNLEEARRLIVETGQLFLSKFNENKKIRPFLHNCPFSSKNIEIVIFVSQSDGNDFSEGNIAVLSLRRGAISYKLTTSCEFSPWSVLHEETYEEALKIINEGS